MPENIRVYRETDQKKCKNWLSNSFVQGNSFLYWCALTLTHSALNLFFPFSRFVIIDTLKRRKFSKPFGWRPFYRNANKWILSRACDPKYRQPVPAPCPSPSRSLPLSLINLKDCMNDQKWPRVIPLWAQNVRNTLSNNTQNM